jgi:hypothetical protein
VTETTKLPIAVALSGGGHRATLATLGALMALVDRGLNDQVVQIASVSGGSITNAFVAQRCDYTRIAPAEIDALATDLVRRVTAGCLTSTWIAALVAGPLALGAATAVLIGAVWSVLAGCLVGAAVAAVGLTGAGHGVQWRLRRRYFSDGTPGTSNPTIGSIPDRAVEHVFCATDLVIGAPVYVSTCSAGVLWRRTGLSTHGATARVHGQRWDASALALAEVVRSSAAFPGIPPRRILFGRRTRLRQLPDARLTFGGAVEPSAATGPKLPSAGLLADGGMWNNLGTQVVREDRFIGGEPNGRVPRVVFCLNGSAPLTPGSAFWYRIPGVGALVAFVRGTKILNSNTVWPRVLSMQSALFGRASTTPMSLAETTSTLDVVADVFRPVDTVVSSIRTATADHSTVPGLVSHDSIDDVETSAQWRDLCELADGPVDVPTTLGRIDAESALRLVARGYLNTYVLSLFIKDASSNVELLAPLPGLRKRLEAIAPAARSAVNAR